MKAINIKPALQALKEKDAAREHLRHTHEFTRLYGDVDRDEARARLRDAETKYYQIANDLLGTAIKEAEGKARERTITADQIVAAVSEIDQKLSISKKAMEGLTVDVDINAQDFPHAYKFTPMSSQFQAEFKNGSWRIICIARDRCRRHAQNVIITHTEASREAIVDRFTTFRI